MEEYELCLMKLVFIHLAEKVKKDIEGNVYTDGSYDMHIWNRYLMLFDTITLVMRSDPHIYSVEEATKKFNIISSNKIFCKFIPDRNSSFFSYINPALRLQRKEIIKNEINQSDAVIVRLPGEGKVIDYAKKSKKKYMVEVVGCPFDTLWNHSLRGKILAIPSYLKLKRAMKKAEYAIYVTNEFLQKRYPTNGKQIGCSDVFIREQKFEIRTKNKKEIVLGTAAATDIKYKGQQYVLKALYDLKKQTDTHYIYQIAGNGDTKYLRSLVEKYNLSDSVVFLGSIPHSDMDDWYRSLDLYIQPSTQEGLPRALIEAMSNSISCIGSDAGGIPELLENNAIFHKRNVKQLVNRILFFSDFENRKRNAEKCYLKSQNYIYDKLEQKRLLFMKKIFMEENNGKK